MPIATTTVVTSSSHLPISSSPPGTLAVKNASMIASQPAANTRSVRSSAITPKNVANRIAQSSHSIASFQSSEWIRAIRPRKTDTPVAHAKYQPSPFGSCPVQAFSATHR